ncbi:fatty acyl-AMP ligase [Streptomyces durhamensis]|uniref:fatty acyl-AMP ligase n=1 Tax=Streptomyces durhamensis TaxID=68194 RepID=UPI00068A2B32|nr:fatty acyl-AMP ligase [Streptomyces durhamensis]
MTALRTRSATVWHALLQHAEQGLDAPTITLIPEPGRQHSLRVDTLVEHTQRAAAHLAEHGVGHGDRVVLCLPTGQEFLTAFFATQLLGAMPTAISLPMRFGGAAGVEGQLKDLTGYLRPAAVITTTDVIQALPHLVDTCLIDGEDLLARAHRADAPQHPLRRPRSEDLALIQCTSGSTGRPKGVMISHANMAANCEQFTSAAGWTKADTTVNWVPLYHDMGLFTGLLFPLYVGADTVLMPPSRLLRHPADWLRHISDHHGAVSAAPNFAFGYATARIRDEELDGVDLSSWRISICGAEPVQPATMDRFFTRFARWHLPPTMPLPSYGMAEASLIITTTRPQAALRFDSIDRTRAAVDHHAVDVDPHSPHALHIVDCGTPVAGTEIRIVDDTGTPLPEGRIGHIQFRGPSRTLGYFDLPEETAQAIDGPGWWKTGDLGYLREGGLRITGRSKDLVIIRGANYFPSDFEQAAETVPGVRLGAVIALGHRRPDADSEELHLLVETELDRHQHEALRQAVRSSVTSRTGVTPAQVHLLPKKSIPKTTSGKVQRAKARRLFLDPTPHTEADARPAAS